MALTDAFDRDSPFRLIKFKFPMKELNWILNYWFGWRLLLEYFHRFIHNFGSEWTEMNDAIRQRCIMQQPNSPLTPPHLPSPILIKMTWCRLGKLNFEKLLMNSTSIVGLRRRQRRQRRLRGRDRADEPVTAKFIHEFSRDSHRSFNESRQESTN